MALISQQQSRDHVTGGDARRTCHINQLISHYDPHTWDRFDTPRTCQSRDKDQSPLSGRGHVTALDQ